VLASYIYARAGLETSLLRELQQIDALQLPLKRYGIDFTHPKFLERILPSGVEIHYWTINDPKTMLELYSLGAHGIVTDRADVAIATFN
jgi:glycerophosphoryl diester phosphodiesterase